MSIAGLASGKRLVSASGNATTAWSTTSAHGLPSRVVLERLVHPVAVVPAADHPDVLAVGLGGLGDEGELRVERERDVTDEAAKELVADRARGPLGDRAKQIPAAETRAGLVCVGERRHDPLPAHRC